MVELKYSDIQTRAKGSEHLKDKLNQGDIKAISEAFNTAYQRTYYIIEGRFYGEKEIIECAERIAAFYDEIKLRKTVKDIIKSYERVDQNGK